MQQRVWLRGRRLRHDSLAQDYETFMSLIETTTRRKLMSELIIAGFKGELTADEVLLDLEKMQQIHKINLDDAVVVIRKSDGPIKIKHSNLLVMSDAAMGGLFGMVLGGPAGLLAGAVIGAAIGETVKILKHIGITDDFVKDVADMLEPGSSAIFIRANKHLSDSVVDELKKFNGKLLRSSLSVKDEQELLTALGEVVLLKEKSI
jgi:uncharacterized membrane protein